MLLLPFGLRDSSMPSLLRGDDWLNNQRSIWALWCPSSIPSATVIGNSRRLQDAKSQMDIWRVSTNVFCHMQPWHFTSPQVIVFRKIKGRTPMLNIRIFRDAIETCFDSMRLTAVIGWKCQKSSQMMRYIFLYRHYLWPSGRTTVSGPKEPVNANNKSAKVCQINYITK